MLPQRHNETTARTKKVTWEHSIVIVFYGEKLSEN